MATVNIKSGSRLHLGFEAENGKDVDFNMVCMFYKAMDETMFLVSVPMLGGKPLELDENKKLYIKYGAGDDTMVIAGYADDMVKEGLHRYWKIRRISEQRQFFQRSDERINVMLKASYYSDTWPLIDGKPEMEEAMTMDISAGGAALCLNRHMDVGEVIMVNVPRVGAIEAIPNVVSAICWYREAPKGGMFKFICGVQFRFAEGTEEREQMRTYVDSVKKKYKL